MAVITGDVVSRMLTAAILSTLLGTVACQSMCSICINSYELDLVIDHFQNASSSTNNLGFSWGTDKAQFQKLGNGRFSIQSDSPSYQVSHLFFILFF